MFSGLEDTAEFLEIVQWFGRDHDPLVALLLFLEAAEMAPCIVLSFKPSSIELHGCCRHAASGLGVGHRHQETHTLSGRRARRKGLDVGEQVLVEFLCFFCGKEATFTASVGASQRQRPLDR